MECVVFVCIIVVLFVCYFGNEVVLNVMVRNSYQCILVRYWICWAVLFFVCNELSFRATCCLQGCICICMLFLQLCYCTLLSVAKIIWHLRWISK
jgi:hypothetical protein